MAKTSSINRNEKRRKMAKLAEGKRKRLKALIKNKQTPMEERFSAVLKLAAEPRNSAKNRIRNRCEVTGRPRAYYRKLKMSRIALRELASLGLIPGMVKSSW
ncbi:MAG: 30S ribosomal protein S14 [Proteobacteria bacterium]|nr:30S ribosomal protein S14 [Pseudomonadota bacterium]